MIDSLRVFSFLADHPPQRPPQFAAIQRGNAASFSPRDTFQRLAGANLQKRHNLHRSQQKSPTAGASGGVGFFETRTSCVSNTRKQGDLSGGLTMLHRVQRQGVTIAVTMPQS